MWVAGDMYRRRCDLLGFVNGLPLVFIELKKPAVPLKRAFDDNLRDYRGQSIPQLFHPNAFILLSNGSDTKVGTLTSAWEHFFDWKRVLDEDEPEPPRQVSLEVRCAACANRLGCWTTSRISRCSRTAGGRSRKWRRTTSSSA